MNIIESDFKLIKEDSYYTLSVLKNKKELKEDSDSSFKVIGYYVSVYSALKSVLAYRQDKKYPGRESDKDLAKLLYQFKDTMCILTKVQNIIYKPLFELQTRLIKYN